ncbi:MAG: DUF3027 domain-containing protein [Actinomycetaceae bacterium]|nr:DUF3027 domain-containing protein [Actinomycetaceae bacterium]
MPKTDKILVGAVETARAALAPIATDSEIGQHLGACMDGERLCTHAFACEKPGYKGWKWVATLARIPRSRKTTICEVALVPGDGALLAPEWVPWAKRLRPGDMRRGDVLPYIAEDDRLEKNDDVRLEPGYSQADEAEMDALQIDEVGLGRVRVLSKEGRDQAASRWYNNAESGPALTASGRRRRVHTPTCSSCGFLLKMAGSLRTMFGVCANEWSPRDGSVVALDHACGAHSETDENVPALKLPVAAKRIDDIAVEVSDTNS